jgi:hypothetical protein
MARTAGGGVVVFSNCWLMSTGAGAGGCITGVGMAGAIVILFGRAMLIGCWLLGKAGLGVVGLATGRATVDVTGFGGALYDVNGLAVI